MMLGMAGTVAFLGGEVPSSLLLPRQPLDHAELLGFFDKLGLMRGREGGPDEPGWVRKWTTPVTVHPRGEAADAHREQLEGVLDQIATWTGLPFRLGPRHAHPRNSIVVNFVSKSDMKRLYRSDTVLCHTHTEGRRGRLFTARMDICEDYADCLRHEFMHALGFDNHWPGRAGGRGAPSVLAKRHAPERSSDFSYWDRFAIRLLYDPRLRPGTPRHKALPVARDITAELLSI